ALIRGLLIGRPYAAIDGGVVSGEADLHVVQAIQNRIQLDSSVGERDGIQRFGGEFVFDVAGLRSHDGVGVIQEIAAVAVFLGHGQVDAGKIEVAVTDDD